jgi:hypothetical protein
MNAQDDRTPEGEPLQFSSHLLPALHAAAELVVETACDGDWEDNQLARVRPAVQMLDALEAGTHTREQIAALADRAATMQGEAMTSEAEDRGMAFPVTVQAAWPVTADAADVLKGRACLTSDLIRLRDEARG